MTYFVYLIGSYRKKKLITYVGYTNNLNYRIEKHNNGKGAKFTKGGNWKLMYFEKYKTKKRAMSREYYIKNNRGFRDLLKNKYK